MIDSVMDKTLFWDHCHDEKLSIFVFIMASILTSSPTPLAEVQFKPTLFVQRYNLMPFKQSFL